MYQIATTYIDRKGNLKIIFDQLDIYNVLRNELGFRYVKVNNKGHYLRYNNGIYDVVGFYHLRDMFKEFINDIFPKLAISDEINFKQFMNEYYKQSPIKNSNFARNYLGENFQLTESNLEKVLNSLK